MSYKVAAQLGVDGEELLDFFLTFSRFEFALKTTGFFRPCHQRRRQRNEPDEYPDAEPDWNAFATSIEGSFRPDADPVSSLVIPKGCLAVSSKVREEYKDAAL